MDTTVGWRERGSNRWSFEHWPTCLTSWTRPWQIIPGADRVTNHQWWWQSSVLISQDQLVNPTVHSCVYIMLINTCCGTNTMKPICIPVPSNNYIFIETVRNAPWHRALITEPSIINYHNLYCDTNGSPGKPPPPPLVSVFPLILFHFIFIHSNLLNSNARRHGAMLFWQVKWLQATLCFPVSL